MAALAALEAVPLPMMQRARGEGRVVATTRNGKTVHFFVPPGKMWLEGDNPSNSIDSRVYGPVPIGLTVGRIICRVWPFALAKEWTQKEETAC